MCKKLVFAIVWVACLLLSPGICFQNLEKDNDRKFLVFNLNWGVLHLLQQKKKWEPPAAPTRVGKKQKRQNKGASLGSKLPIITPNAKCKLRLLKLERVKDYLLMEEQFVKQQELLTPQEAKNQEDRTKVDYSSCKFN